MVEASSSKQTLSFIKRRLEESGIRPRTKFGQNFLIDLNLLRILAESAQLSANDVVLEIGTGMGSLTALMAPHVAAVVTVEIDPRMFQLASEELHSLRNVTMLRADALRNKNRLNPEVLEVVKSHLNAAPGRRLKLVANLPFKVATPVLSTLLAENNPPQTMTATIQKELADRITAKPGTKDYCALSIWIQSQCRAAILRELPPSVFWPRPKVSAAFLHIAFQQGMRARIADLEFFHAFVRALFFHRRKFLRSQLLTAAQNRLDKTGVDAILKRLRLDPSLRAEQLDVDTIISLTEAVQSEFAS